MMHSLMDVENFRSYVDDLFSSDVSICLKAVVQIKNMIIGSNKQKDAIIQQGILPRLIQLLGSSDVTAELRHETILVFGSLAQGTDLHVKALVDSGVIPFLFTCIYGSFSRETTQHALRSLKNLLRHQSAPTELLFNDPHLIPQMLRLLPLSVSNQISVSTIFMSCCKSEDHQSLLCTNGAISALSPLLISPVSTVQLAVLDCLSALCYQNSRVSSHLATYSFGGKTVPDHLVNLLTRDKSTDMQLSTARCLTYLYRAGALNSTDPKILYRTLPCLVRMCRKDRKASDRILGAETLAYLIEVDTELQRVAAISDHLITNLSLYLKGKTGLVISDTLGLTPPPSPSNNRKISTKEVDDLKQAALRAYASLAANDEDIRKKVIEVDNLMDQVVSGLGEVNHKVCLASVRCLHSLSRSVQQLRTTFQDHSVWKPLMRLLHDANTPEILTVASSTLCNLLLEFSPSKEHILEAGAIDLLCNLTHREDPALRLNGVWALMNMAFQADQKVKVQILSSLGTDQIFRLLSDHEVCVVMKTLGLLRNLLSTKPHIDSIMAQHGRQIMQAVVFILEGEHSTDVKEQALCILANIADGDSAKDSIMANDDVLRKLINYMAHSNVKLQTAATFCVANLAWREDAGSLERQARLRELGVFRILQQLISTTDGALFDRVKSALQQFS